MTGKPLHVDFPALKPFPTTFDGNMLSEDFQQFGMLAQEMGCDSGTEATEMWMAGGQYVPPENWAPYIIFWRVRNWA